MVDKLLDPSHRPVLMVLGCVIVLLIACCCAGAAAGVAGGAIYGSSGGACVVDSPTGRPAWAHCYDGWTAAECGDLSDTGYHSGRSCKSLGFTQQCSGEGSVWRRPAYACD